MSMKRLRWTAMLLCAMLLAAAPAAQAVTVDYGAKGSIQLQLHLDIKPAPDLSGTVFSLYRIGDVDNTAGGFLYRLRGVFAGSLLASPLEYNTSEEAKKAAEYLVGFVRDKHILPLTTVLTDANGKAVFSSVVVGAYLVSASKGPSGLAVSPFIVSVPRFTKDHGVEKLTYDLAVQPKADFVPTPTPTPSVSPTPCTTCPTGGSGPPPPLPQTGFLQWPIIALAAGGGLFLVLGAAALLMARKRKRSER